MKYSSQSKPTERKRSFKVIANDKGTYRVVYMGKYKVCYNESELLAEIDECIGTITGWATKL